jgi:hypothetical protein
MILNGGETWLKTKLILFVRVSQIYLYRTQSL